MQRTTVKISDELDARLRHEAMRSGRSISEITRDALKHYLVENGGLSFAGAGRSGRSDISMRIEEILRDEADR